MPDILDFDGPYLYNYAWTGKLKPLQINAPATAGGANPEWFTYGFAPIVWSAGGDLINRSSYRTAQGALNSPERQPARVRRRSRG